MSKTEELEAALVATFPATAIDRAMLDEPTAHWDVYDEPATLPAFEGLTWLEISTALLEQHALHPVFAGDALWRATLPAYLRYLLHTPTKYTQIPAQLAHQLTRRTESEQRFDRRVAPLSVAQRAVIRDVIDTLGTMPGVEDAMRLALETWQQL